MLLSNHFFIVIVVIIGNLCRFSGRLCTFDSGLNTFFSKACDLVLWRIAKGFYDCRK